MTVALVAAIARHVSLPLTQEMLAVIACEIEIDLMQRPIGRQDQYASAIGGINTLTFERTGVAIEPLALRPGLDELLLDHLLLVSTRRTRDSATVLRSQRAASATDSDVTLRLHRIKELATGMREALIHDDLVRFGALLDESWHFKRGLARGVSSPAIDRWYGIARQCGAYGGKITGAGGGGFFLFCVPPERRQHVIAGLHKAGLRPLSFTFDHVGCVVQDGASLSHFDSRLSRKGNHYETANLRHS
jgi:D-glycero-alpha-D-manno-heptose-7-phosphate kinase